LFHNLMRLEASHDAPIFIAIYAARGQQLMQHAANNRIGAGGALNASSRA
jgi:hypothetical protein